MKWIKTSQEKPPIGPSKDNIIENCSRRVLVYHKNYGVRFGQYFPALKWWRIEGCSGKYNVTKWAYYTDPTLKTN